MCTVRKNVDTGNSIIMKIKLSCSCNVIHVLEEYALISGHGGGGGGSDPGDTRAWRGNC